MIPTAIAVCRYDQGCAHNVLFLRLIRGQASRESDVMAKCNVCGKSMKNGFALKIHMGRMHKTSAQPSAKRRSPGTDLTSASTSALLAELRRRADVYDRLKALTF